MAKASDNVFPSVLFVEGSAPASPASGDQRIFIDVADHKLKRKDNGGTVTTIEGGGGGTSAAELGYVQVTTPQTSIPSTVTDLTSLTLTVTVGTRAIVVEAYIPLFDVTGATAGRMQLQIIDVTASNAVIGIGYAVTSATSNGGTGVAKIRVAPSAGSRQYKLAAACDTGTTGRAFCGATQPMWLRIYEV